MKKQIRKIIFGIMLITWSASYAQPVLTATGINPVIGESFIGIKTSYLGHGSGGAGQTWNFSSIGLGLGVTRSALTVASTSAAAMFPNANTAFSNTLYSGNSYVKTSATALQNYGYMPASTCEKSYINPEDILRFPFTYTDSYIDTLTALWDTGSINLHRRGITTVTADGYGTLITPSGTFTNVTRVHMVQTYRDTIIGGTYSIIHGNDQYLWYKDGYHSPLAVAAVITLYGSVDSTGYYYSSTVGIDEQNEQLISFDVFPNPSEGHLNIEFSLPGNKKVAVELFNSLGQKMDVTSTLEGVKGKNTVQLDLSNLPEGIYFAELMIDGKIAGTKRVVVAK
jgi:type IX secretion system substrate protein